MTIIPHQRYWWIKLQALLWNFHEHEGVLYVPGLKKNLLSILALDKKGYRVAFINGQVLIWPKGKTLEYVVVIGEEEGGLYKPKGHPKTTLVYETTSSSELWHRRIAHIKYKAFPYVSKVVTGLPYLNIEHEGTYKGCPQGRTSRIYFWKVTQRLKVRWK